MRHYVIAFYGSPSCVFLNFTFLLYLSVCIMHMILHTAWYCYCIYCYIMMMWLFSEHICIYMTNNVQFFMQCNVCCHSIVFVVVTIVSVLVSHGSHVHSILCVNAFISQSFIFFVHYFQCFGAVGWTTLTFEICWSGIFWQLALLNSWDSIWTQTSHGGPMSRLCCLKPPNDSIFLSC